MGFLRPFYRRGFIEEWSRGTNRMADLATAAMLTAMRSADSLTESRARCAYRAVMRWSVHRQLSGCRAGLRPLQ